MNGPFDETLNGATLHWHYGHGSMDPGSNHTAIVLMKKNQSTGLLESDFLWPSEITTKWGGKNKWVVLQSCYLLSDVNWGNALGTTHGIFGYTTVTNMKPEIAQIFLSYAIRGNVLSDSWYDATVDVYKGDKVATNWIKDASDNWVLDNSNKANISAAIIFKTDEQRILDHLPGTGNVAPDYEENDRIKRTIWDCGSGEVV